MSLRARVAVLSLAACTACRPVEPTSPPAAMDRPAATSPPAAASPSPFVALRFLERADRRAPWQPVRDEARLAALQRLVDNEPARFALALYAEAWAIAPPPAPAEPSLFIGLEPGGNHAGVGLELDDDGRRTSLPHLPYLRLEEDPEVLRGTLLHETGHAVHALLAFGAPARDLADDPAIAPIPHSTAAVTDRSTALAEGFAIHLDTILAHCGRDPATRAFYDHAALHPGPTGDVRSEYFFVARDVMTYAQTFARYQAVRDGLYAFEPAARGDYLRVQLDPARDLRTLRAPGALVASEGFVAAVLFQTMAAAGCDDGLPGLVLRYRPLLQALRAAETGTGPLDAIPLLDLVAALGPDAITVFLDLSHGVTVDAEAAALWADLYDAALRVDVEARRRLVAELEPRRVRWRDASIADPTRLAARIGPVVVVEVPAVSVEIPAFGPARPLAFDANAAGAPMLALVPGWTAAHVDAVLAERARAPFDDLDDLHRRLRALRVPTRGLSEPRPAEPSTGEPPR